MRLRSWSLAVALVGVMLTAPTPAQASEEAIIDLACPGYSRTNYRPGLTNTARPVGIKQHGTVGPCLATAHPYLTSGSWRLSAKGTLSCQGGTASGLRVYKWNNGSVSVEKVSLTFDLRAQGQAVLTSRGRIVGGAFKGDVVRSQAVLVSTDLLGCLTEAGLGSTAGPRLIQFFAG